MRVNHGERDAAGGPLQVLKVLGARALPGISESPTARERPASATPARKAARPRHDASLRQQGCCPRGEAPARQRRPLRRRRNPRSSAFGRRGMPTQATPTRARLGALAQEKLAQRRTLRKKATTGWQILLNDEALGLPRAYGGWWCQRLLTWGKLRLPSKQVRSREAGAIEARPQERWGFYTALRARTVKILSQQSGKSPASM